MWQCGGRDRLVSWPGPKPPDILGQVLSFVTLAMSNIACQSLVCTLISLSDRWSPTLPAIAHAELLNSLSVLRAGARVNLNKERIKSVAEDGRSRPRFYQWKRNLMHPFTRAWAQRTIQIVENILLTYNMASGFDCYILFMLTVHWLEFFSGFVDVWYRSRLDINTFVGIYLR